MKKHAIIAFATLAFAALTAIAQYSTMATRAYCDRNRELAAAEAVQELGPQIQPAVSQEVQRIAQDIATNLYPIVVVETNLIIVATQIVDNVISNYTIVSNVLVYSENTYVTNNIIAQTNLVVNMTNSYYVSNYTNVYNNIITNNIFALTNIETTVSNTYYVTNYTNVYVTVRNNYTTNHIYELRNATDVLASNRVVNGNYDFNNALETFGRWSVASGNGSKPLAEGAHAEGYQTIAGAPYSISAGRQTFASGPYSIAVGDNTTSANSYTLASGRNSIAGGFLSEAHGDNANATNSRSYVWSGLSSGSGSHGDGTYTINPVGGPFGFYIDGYSLPEIISNIAPREVNVSLIGNELNIQGTKTNIVTIQANNGIAIGEQTIASGANSLAAGWQTDASGVSSFTAGRQSRSIGNYSVAIGNNTVASNTYSIAEGNGSVAFGAQSKASGFMATTIHRNSYVWNGDTSISNYQSHGIGTFNVNPVSGMNGFFIGSQNIGGVVSSLDSKIDSNMTSVSNSMTSLNGSINGLRSSISTANNNIADLDEKISYSGIGNNYFRAADNTSGFTPPPYCISFGRYSIPGHHDSFLVTCHTNEVATDAHGSGCVGFTTLNWRYNNATQNINDALERFRINGVTLRDLIKHVIEHPNEQ